MIKTPKPYRLDKYLCACGQGSRSQVTRFIKHGRVKVNGYVTTSGATRIVSTDTVHLDDVLLSEAAPVLLWHKPTGVQCTIGDPMGRISLVDLIPSDILNRYHPVGRLDADTSGLLLFSRFGALTQRLLHPKHGLPRSYQAICEIIDEIKVILEEFDTNWVEYEKLYVIELMLIEQDARRFI